MEIDQSTLLSIGQAIGKLHAWRSTQLDSELLEREIGSLLFSSDRLASVFKYTPLWHSFIQGTAEGDTLRMTLEALLQSFFLLKNNATLGQMLLGIEYEKESKLQKLVFVSFQYLLPLLLRKSGASNYWKLLGVLVKFGNLVCLLQFFVTGKWKSLGECVASLQVVRHPIGAYSLAFEFVERQLVIGCLEQVVGNATRIYKILFGNKQKLNKSLFNSTVGCIKCGIEDGVLLKGSPCGHTICHWCLCKSENNGKCCKKLKQVKRIF